MQINANGQTAAPPDANTPAPGPPMPPIPPEDVVHPIGGQPQSQSQSTPAQLPMNVMLGFMDVLVKYLLYEKREETNLQLAFTKLVSERHAHFHVKNTDFKDVPSDDWQSCGNIVCKEAKRIIEDGRKPEVEIMPLSAQLMREYQVAINPSQRSLRAKLVERGDQRITPAPANVLDQLHGAEQPAPRPTGKLIIGG